MFKLVHKLTGATILRFDDLSEAVTALQGAAVPALYYITNQL